MSGEEKSILSFSGKGKGRLLKMSWRELSDIHVQCATIIALVSFVLSVVLAFYSDRP